jgi:hypothetical protein
LPEETTSAPDEHDDGDADDAGEEENDEGDEDDDGGVPEQAVLERVVRTQLHDGRAQDGPGVEVIKRFFIRR